MPPVNLGVLPSTPITRNFTMIASVFEFLLLSFALADRIKQLQTQATANAELAAQNARLAAENAQAAQAATAHALAEEARANALKDEFLANTSHELRTPLHGMLGLTEAVVSDEAGLSRSARERLAMVVASGRRLGSAPRVGASGRRLGSAPRVGASGRRLASLVNDILDFSKLRHQAITLREKTFDVHDAVALALSVVGRVRFV